MDFGVPLFFFFLKKELAALVGMQAVNKIRMSDSWELTGNLYAAMFIIQPLLHSQMKEQQSNNLLHIYLRQIFSFKGEVHLLYWLGTECGGLTSCNVTG